MTMTLHSTDKLVTLNGVPARVWEGETASGTAVIAMITRVAVDRDAAPERIAEFERDLQEHRRPSVEASAFPARMGV